MVVMVKKNEDVPDVPARIWSVYGETLFFLRTGNSSVDLRWVLWFRTFINIYWWLDFLSFNIYIYTIIQYVWFLCMEREREDKEKQILLVASIIFGLPFLWGSLSFTVTVCYGSHGTSQEKFLESLKAIPGVEQVRLLAGNIMNPSVFFGKHMVMGQNTAPRMVPG